MNLTEAQAVALLEKAKGQGFARVNIKLSKIERARLFYWCRDQAHDCLVLAKQLTEHGAMMHTYAQEALDFLCIAQKVYPLSRDRETVSIEDILNGKEPSVAHGNS